MNKWFFFTRILFLWLACTHASVSHATSNELPTLGDSTSGFISLQQEKILGSSWLRSLRRQVKTFHDPLTYSYLTSLVFRLAPNSELTQRDLNLVIVDSSAMNAFAVPGGVMGINAGLFIHSGSEQEFASVIAHEIAHLSQRHYARSLERQQKTTPLALAGLLASVIIAATTGSDAGIAALASTQALAIQSQLSYSRQNEQEADRIGIQTLFDSNMDPKAMPTMFERMLREARLYGNRPPEYLSTHPVTESRVSDSRNRAEQYPVKAYTEDLEFHLIRSRVLLHYSESGDAAVRHFESAIDQGNTFNKVASQYGLAIALNKTGKPDEALVAITPLLEQYPNRIIFIVGKATFMAKNGQLNESIELLRKHLSRNPGNYAISWALSKQIATRGQINDLIEAESLLTRIARSHPNEPKVWYTLAEVNGEVGNIVQLHQSRAEFFYLIGEIDDALLQLQQALKKSQGNTQVTAIIQQRIDDLYKAKKGINF
ncbi:M48 family metalloprotease [Alkalimarinus alittae]|uniref:Putative beta-barrel assembly-enhancing protease n=1 Tax=Alkalimarinus alittae TaxID=2961619 RepID=A0ABY6N688_9ALTE|nr:M48 family metalloprotease [Alkalimarinus alittae]UZE97606.1 M48 family metalloprotease [Alkalimarinus alittae]